MSEPEHTGRPDQAYLEPYRDAVERYGPGFEATLWGSREAQRLRFDVMIDLAGFDGCTILDVGCGHGDFAEHLLAREVPFTRYIGLDAIPAVIERAQGRGLDLEGGRVTFLVSDVVVETEVLSSFDADYTCFSGTLNTMDDETIGRLVLSAFHGSARGVLFNFLSDRHHERWKGADLAPARRLDTVAWLDWSLSHTSRVSFTQDYLDGHDATIMMRKAES